MLTLEKNILPPLLPGIDPVTAITCLLLYQLSDFNSHGAMLPYARIPISDDELKTTSERRHPNKKIDIKSTQYFNTKTSF